MAGGEEILADNHCALGRVSLTLAVLIYVVIFAVLIWDVWVTIQGREDQTVSAIVGNWSRRYPIITLSVGVVVGHIFWR